MNQEFGTKELLETISESYFKGFGNGAESLFRVMHAAPFLSRLKMCLMLLTFKYLAEGTKEDLVRDILEPMKKVTNQC